MSGHDCSSAIAQLWAYLDSELAELDAERVRRHLDECEGCLTEFQIELVVRRVVRRCCTERAPEALRLRIHEQIVLLGPVQP